MQLVTQNLKVVTQSSNITTLLLSSVNHSFTLLNG